MNKLKEYRVKNNFTCDFMANILGISKSFYWQIENKKRRLSYDMAVSIAEIFNLTPDQLFYDDFIELGI